MRLSFASVSMLTMLLFANIARGQSCPLDQIKVPDGYTVELAAAAPLVKHPLMACFDEQGRLYVAANAGRNLRREDLEKELPNFVQRLEDTDGDGVFDKSVVFADKMTFPQGCLWYRGWLYVASSGAIWKMRDTDGDGRADERIKLVGDFGYTGNAADVHGPFLGREGRIYWCEGRHGHEFRDADGNVTSRGKAARIFSCLPDGSDVQTWCTGGMDNPVEIVFTPEGDMLGTVNLMYARPRGDCLVHWQWGGVYPREDFVDQLGGEFYRTGELLREVHNYGHVALSGLCRYESNVFGDDVEGDLFITQFNTGKIIRTKLKRKGATYEIESNRDFLTVDCEDFHPTDVLEDADGSLLVIDTGGWFRIGCPESQVAKPDVHGAIYRIRKKGTEPVKDPRGMDIAWKDLKPKHLLELLDDPRPVVRERATEHFATQTDPDERLHYDEIDGRKWSDTSKREFMWAAARSRNNHYLDLAGIMMFTKQEEDPIYLPYLHALASVKRTEQQRQQTSGDQVRIRNEIVFHGETYGILSNSPAKQVAGARAVANRKYPYPVQILETAFEPFTMIKPFGRSVVIKEPENIDDIDPLVRHAFIYALIQTDDREALIAARRNGSPVMREFAGVALEQLHRKLGATDGNDYLLLPSPETGTPLSDEQREKLLEVEASLPEGDEERGQQLYVFSKRTDCRKCHQINGDGGLAGPDLSNVGERRKQRDLLESILYPSASFARGFEPYSIATKEGKVHSGIILGETEKEIRLGIAAKDDEENSVLISRNQIDEIRATNVSIMPANVHEQLSLQELADLIAYLLAQRQEKRDGGLIE